MQQTPTETSSAKLFVGQVPNNTTEEEVYLWFTFRIFTKICCSSLKQSFLRSEPWKVSKSSLTALLDNERVEHHRVKLRIWISILGCGFVTMSNRQEGAAAIAATNDVMTLPGVISS